MAELKKDMCVKFKSLPEYWEKELDNRKPNTVRVVDWEDKRFQNLKENNYARIKIFNTRTNESFERIIEDITFFSTHTIELVIISWEDKNFR